MTIHTDISEIIGKCRHVLTLEASFSSGGYSINFYTGRLRPEVQPFYLAHTPPEQCDHNELELELESKLDVSGFEPTA